MSFAPVYLPVHRGNRLKRLRTLEQKRVGPSKTSELYPIRCLIEAVPGVGPAVSTGILEKRDVGQVLSALVALPKSTCYD
jgi:hypothetical protein